MDGLVIRRDVELGDTVMSGVYPALKASRLRPVDAIRAA